MGNYTADKMFTKFHSQDNTLITILSEKVTKNFYIHYDVKDIETKV